MPGVLTPLESATMVRRAWRHNIGIFTTGIVLVVVVIGMPPLAPAGPAFGGPKGGAIFICSLKEKEYDNPRECVKGCSEGPVRFGLCSVKIEAACPRLKELNPEDPWDRAYANAVLWHTSLKFGPYLKGTLEGVRTKLIQRIIDKYFAEPRGRYADRRKSIDALNAVKRRIEFAQPGGGDWAHYGEGVLTVRRDLFRQSLAFIVSTIGHEMIHLTQDFRSIQKAPAGIDSATTAFLELEAWAWEANENYAWDYDTPSPGFRCLRQGDREDSIDAIRRELRCYEWQIPKRVNDILTGPRNPESNARLLQRWLEANSWTKVHWLPRHQNWPNEYGRNYDVPPRPAGC